MVLLVYVGFETGRNEVASEMGSCEGWCRKMPGGGSLGYGEWGWWRGGAGGQHSAPGLGFWRVLTQSFVFALGAVPVQALSITPCPCGGTPPSQTSIAPRLFNTSPGTGADAGHALYFPALVSLPGADGWCQSWWFGSSDAGTGLVLSTIALGRC